MLEGLNNSHYLLTLDATNMAPRARSVDRRSVHDGKSQNGFADKPETSQSYGTRLRLNNMQVLLDEQEKKSDDKKDTSGEPEDKDLSLREETRVRKMKARDREVRDHERAHANVGGGIAGSPKYEMMIGPDGHSYAVGGEVKINLIKASTPESTIERMDQIIRAAMAPVRPSAGDRSVAVRAREIKMEAEIEITQKRNDDEGVGQNIDQVY